MDAKLKSKIKHLYNMFFDFLSRFVRIWLKSLQKVLIRHKNFPPNIFIMGRKNAEFDADFEAIGKVATKFILRKFEGWELLYTVLKGEKVHNFYIFKLITFFYELFYTFFNGLKSASNSSFFDTHIKKL